MPISDLWQRREAGLPAGPGAGPRGQARAWGSPARRSPRGTGVRSRSPRRASDWQGSRGEPGRRDGGDIKAVRRAAGILPNSPRSGSKLCQRDSSSGARDVKGIPDCTLIPSGLHPDSSQTESDTECTTWEQTPISRRPSLTKWCVN